MHNRSLLSLLALFLAPAALFAQTQDIQDQVDALLARPWYVRVWMWLEATTGVSPAISLPLLLALVAGIVLLFVWRGRGQRTQESRP
jgi:hypothetical protein